MNPVDVASKRAERSTQRRLTDAERHAIVAMWATQGSITHVANHFNVHRNTVSDLVKSVKSVQNADSSDWRKKLTEELPTKAVAAIERSLIDETDVHKAAGTALSYFKGTGVMSGDSPAVNVFVGSIANMPADLAGDYFDITPTPTGSDSLPDSGVSDETSR